MIRVLSCLIFCGLLAACSGMHDGRKALANSLTPGWHLKEFKDSKLMIVGLQKPEVISDRTLRIYIEGDGFAWATIDQPSDDPTPHQGLALQLAKLDSYAQILYLGRPCQYEARNTERCNDNRWWTSARFSRDVLDSYHQILAQLKQENATLQFELIGYSGGAAIAAILAAERNDVVGLRTIAGNLDTEAVNRAHKASSISASLNPIAFARQLQVKQLHYIGLGDKVIPHEVAVNFAQAQIGKCVEIVQVASATHWQGWEQLWPELLKYSWPVCRAPEVN